MQTASAAYKEEMAKGLRNESYVWVRMGVISREAQSSGYVSTSLAFCATGNVFNNAEFEAYYASGEQDFARVDGTMFFPPAVGGPVALYQGAFTDALNGAIRFDFDGYSSLDIKGLTIDFGEIYPTAFTVANGSVTRSYTMDSPGQFITEDTFADSSYILITPTSMIGGNKRMRILNMTFGVGLSFDNTSLLSTSRRNIVSHLSGALPSKSFQFVVDNRTRRFAVDNPDSFINFLEQQQEVEYEYGRKLDDGTIYKINGGQVKLKTWSSDHMKATFDAVGSIDFLDGQFFKGKWYPGGRTAYQLAEDILLDAGIENYRLDPYLQTVTLHNPVPVDTHKNCLQMIANLCRSVIYEDRDGSIVIRASFIPEITQITASNQAAWSNIANINQDATLYTYATGEADFVRANGATRFLPNAASPQNTGYVSNALSSGSGYPASVSVYFEAAWNFYSISLEFDPDSYPTRIGVRKYTSATESNVEYVDVDSYNPTIGVTCNGVSRVTLYFYGIPENQRVHLNRVSFSELSDYFISKEDMTGDLVAAATEAVKQIDVHYYEVTAGAEADRKNVTTVSASQGANTTVFKTAYRQGYYQLAYKDSGVSGTLSVTDSGAYYVAFTSSVAAQVQITGIPLEIGDSVLTVANRDIGGVKTLQNDLIDSATMAQDQAEWIAEYYNGGVDYSITYRGDPRIDCDDIVYIDNDYYGISTVRIEEEQLDTAIGMSSTNKIVARRVPVGG